MFVDGIQPSVIKADLNYAEVGTIVVIGFLQKTALPVMVLRQ